MPINVIESKSRVVLHHEDERVGPETGMRDGLDNSSQGEIIVGHRRTRCRHAWRRSKSVIRWQQQD